MKEEKKKREQERRKNYTELYKSGVMGMILPERDKFLVAAKYSKNPKLTDKEVAEIFYMAGFSEKVLSGPAINVKLNNARKKLDEIIKRHGGSVKEVIEHFKTPAKMDKLNEGKQHCLIDELNLSDKVFSILEILGCKSTVDIINNYKLLLRVENLDKKDLFEIVHAVHNRGLSFSKYDEERIKNDVDLQKYQPFKESNLSIRIINCLTIAGFETWGDVANRKIESLPSIRLLGGPGCARVANEVHKFGLSFQDEPSLKSSDNMCVSELLDQNWRLNDLNEVNQDFLVHSEQEFKNLIEEYEESSQSNYYILERLRLLREDIGAFEEAVQEYKGGNVKKKK